MNEGLIPAALITFREVLEATLIVATVVTLLTKLKQTPKNSYLLPCSTCTRRKGESTGQASSRSQVASIGLKAVWWGTGAAVVASVVALLAASLAGIRLQEIYFGKTEKLIEGMLMVGSAVFVTWAVFFLHTHFAQQKVRLLAKIKKTVAVEENRGLFILTFTAVFREGLEIVLFLSTIYLSSNPREILGGFVVGMVGALVVCWGLFSLTLRLPVYVAFRVTSLLLILFAAGMLSRGVHAFSELGWIPETRELTLAFIPVAQSFAGEMVKALFGLRRSMDGVQLLVYGGYVSLMSWWVFGRRGPVNQLSS